jgi:glutamate dehydrogenase
MTRWLLNRPGESLVIANMVERYTAPMKQLRDALPGMLPPTARTQLQSDLGAWKKLGFPTSSRSAWPACPG